MRKLLLVPNYLACKFIVIKSLNDGPALLVVAGSLDN